MISAPHQSQNVRLQPGKGTLLTSTANGFSIANPRAGVSFNHPWRPVLVGSGTGAGLRIARGVVDGKYEPKINDKLMSGETGELPPILTLSASEINQATNESWAVLQVTPNAKGQIDEKSKVEIIHAAAPGGSIGGTIGRTAVACIVWKNKKPVMVWPVLFFNLRYVQKTSTTGPVQHFFL